MGFSSFPGLARLACRKAVGGEKGRPVDADMPVNVLGISGMDSRV